MPGNSIVDVSAGAAQTIGRYFSVVSVIPSSLYVGFVYLLIASDSWRRWPDWGDGFRSLAHLGFAGVALLAFLSIGLGIVIHPIQFAVVQFFEGYWGATPVAQAVRSQRIRHYQAVFKELRREKFSANHQLDNLNKAGVTDPAARVLPLSRYHEASRLRENFPRAIDQVMPTRLGNALRRAESQAGSQYGMDALQMVPHLLMIAPASHVDYVNDQRSQLDLAVRMTFISALAAATALLFLWPYRLWALIAVVPYTLAYVSYKGSVVAASHYGSALEALINLDRFALYEQLRLEPPATTASERALNRKLGRLFQYDNSQVTRYKHPPTSQGPGTP
jgi:hypothetical protein